MTPHDQPLHSRAEVLRRGIAAAGLLAALGERVVPWLHDPRRERDLDAASDPRLREVPLRGRTLARGEDTPRSRSSGCTGRGPARSASGSARAVASAPGSRRSSTRRPTATGRGGAADGDSAPLSGRARWTRSSTASRARCARLRRPLRRLRARGRARSRIGRDPADHPARGLGRGRVDRARGPLVRVGADARDHPSHRRQEPRHAGGVRGGRPGDPGLPRRVERLERHRLQLPRRPVRPGLRGSRRRDRPPRDRRARALVQHRVDRDRPARELRQEGPDRGGAGRACGPARLAARPRPCRPDRAGRRWAARRHGAAGRFGAPGRERDRVPGREGVPRARRALAGCATRSDCRSCSTRSVATEGGDAPALHRTPVRAQALAGDRDRPGRYDRRDGLRPRRLDRLDVGDRGPAGRPVRLLDRRARRGASGQRHDRTRPGTARRRRRRHRRDRRAPPACRAGSPPGRGSSVPGIGRPRSCAGPRPASAPRRLPSWYWPWFAWQNQLDEWARAYGRRSRPT